MKYVFWIAGFLIVGAVIFAPFFPNFVKRIPAPRGEATVIVGGDMMFDRYIREVSDIVSQDYAFSCIDKTLANADMVMANLEGPVTTNLSVSEGTAVGGGDNLTFTFPPATAATLLKHNIKVVNIGNNHILNFGEAGRTSTEQYLDAAGVAWFDESHVATTTVNGIPLVFINYNQFSGDWQHSNILENVRMFKSQGDIVIVYTHWGEEYKPATDLEKSLAHQFIDAGADIVIGSHPHVVQEYENYRGKSIYYSLGNFIFDQYFSPDVRNGLLLKLTIGKVGVTGVQEIPVEMETDGRTCVAS